MRIEASRRLDAAYIVEVTTFTRPTRAETKTFKDLVKTFKGQLQDNDSSVYFRNRGDAMGFASHLNDDASTYFAEDYVTANAALLATMKFEVELVDKRRLSPSSKRDIIGMLNRLGGMYSHASRNGTVFKFSRLQDARSFRDLVYDHPELSFMVIPVLR